MPGRRRERWIFPIPISPPIWPRRRAPRSAIGWLALALEERRKNGAGPLTILSCDNLQIQWRQAGRRRRPHSRTRCWPGLAPWITANTAFPADPGGLHRAGLGCRPSRPRRGGAGHGPTRPACSARTFAQWVIQDRFAGPLPAWGAVGRRDRAGHRRLSAAEAACAERRPFGAGLSGPAARAHHMCARPSPIRSCATSWTP